MKPLPLLLLFPLFATAQEVRPVLSRDYLELIRKDSIPQKNLLDTTNSMRLARLSSYFYNSGFTLQKISIRKGVLQFHPLKKKTLQLSGQFNSSVEAKIKNRLPDLQDRFVQGRSENGQPRWKGPETAELFSYGPEISSLEFDGSIYPYDINGRLVPTGTGNGVAPTPYSNNIFRTGFNHSHSLLFQGRYMVNSIQALKTTLKLGTANENLFIKYNQNQTENLSVSVDALIKWLTITSNYSSTVDRFSNSNRSGFLNRVYQNSLLSPVSFDNGQGNQVGALQRSYSNLADNPFFLLENQNSYTRSHRTGGIGIAKKYYSFKFSLRQSFENLYEKTYEMYKPSTAYFTNGIDLRRDKKDRNSYLAGGMSYDIDYISNDLSATISTNYNQSNQQSYISYAPVVTDYSYQRTAHDLSLQYLMKYDYNNGNAFLLLANKIYASSTSANNDYFLPSINASFRLGQLFGTSNWQLRLFASFNNFASELAIDKSFTENNLLQYQTGQSFQYLSQLEVEHYNDLSLTRHKEWTGRIELSFRYNLSFQGEFFVRNTTDDVFPVFQNGQIQLKNIAGHSNKGIELDLNWYHSANKNFTTTNKLSFSKNRMRVTEVAAGYDYLSVSGFSNVHKAIVKGKAPGVIIGNRFLRDSESNILIGTDGYPLINATPGVIGDPNPDFIMKLTNSINWKKFNLNIDWQWKKGGDMWNGTQAVLDYYGRSASSGQLRNTEGYIFPGVLQNGRPNDIPVKFYDHSLPVEQNRWTRNGHSGIAEEYIQKADLFKINNLGLSYALGTKKYLRNLILSVYAENILVWTAYKGVDPDQLLFDAAGSSGLDFFNLPSTKTFGFNVSVQF